tara:strand:- start:86 stop:349 length:264 start_codon:yes stop_codon:yes gene_type:complete
MFNNHLADSWTTSSMSNNYKVTIKYTDMNLSFNYPGVPYGSLKSLQDSWAEFVNDTGFGFNDLSKITAQEFVDSFGEFLEVKIKFNN